MPRRLFLLCVALALAYAQVIEAGAPKPTPLSPTDRARLEKGEILVGSTDIADTNFREGVGRALIPMSIERVERAVADVLHYEEFMPFLESSTADRQADDSILSHQTLDLPGLLGTRRLTARFRLARPTPTTYSVAWASLPGSEVRDQHGSFHLEPLGNGTLVTCRFFLDPGGAPAFLVNPQTERSVGWILDGLRQQVNRGRYGGGPERVLARRRNQDSGVDESYNQGSFALSPRRSAISRSNPSQSRKSPPFASI